MTMIHSFKVVWLELASYIDLDFKLNIFVECFISVSLYY